MQRYRKPLQVKKGCSIKKYKKIFELGKEKALKFFGVKKEEGKAIKDEVFEPEEDYNKPIRTGNAFSSNYIESKCKGDKGKSSSF